MFDGFPEKTTQFFMDIRFHNSSSWFEENRERYYQDVRSIFYSFIDQIAPYMLAIDHQMEVRPFKCLSRLRRDVRFTKDKSPYRDHLWLCFHRSGEPRDGSNMFWFELSPENATFGMGFWSENKAVNERVRREMAANPDNFRRVLNKAELGKLGLSACGNTYKRMVFPENLPDDLKPFYALREPVFMKTTADWDMIRSPEIFSHVLACFQALAPLYEYYRGHIDTELENIARTSLDNFSSGDKIQKIHTIEEW